MFYPIALDNPVSSLYNAPSMKSLVFASVLTLAFMAVKPVLAQEQICTQVYGGGVVCGAKHEVVDTDLGDINPQVLGAGFLLASLLTYKLSKKFSSQI